MKRPETADMSEKGYQRLIVKELLTQQQYAGETTTADFDTEFCINKADVLDFIQRTQPLVHAYLEKSGVRKFLVRLDKRIREKGIIEVLRKGIKHRDKTVRLFYAKPNSIYNSEAQTNYEANKFTVTQELVYSHQKTNTNRLDLTIFINGFPLITMELKNAYTHQSVADAIKQYKEDRNPADKIFNFGRCMVHFAVDTSEVFMTTHLAKSKTRFFPFNKGLNDGESVEPFGAGNPNNPNGQKTAYLYEDILSKDSLSNLIEKFVAIVEDEEKNRVQYFPRYHQLTVVRKLLADCKTHGVGKRYLIQHSAGSGKSNSITWLALQLVGLYNDAGDTPFFDSVLVITDRKNLDEQIRNNIKGFAQNKHIFEPITGKSKDIRKMSLTEEKISKTTHTRLALANNKKIISCTVQTFPFVLKAISDMSHKKVAIIIDEAHSSQSGTAAASLNAIFSDGDIEGVAKDENGNYDTEELLAYLCESKKMLPNASYFAFTATPKNKTSETFGIKQPPVIDENGNEKIPHLPFHNYSMKQAIEEEFILDVLQNYTTFQSWYKIRENAKGDKTEEYETKEANKRIRAFVEKQKGSIEDKTKIMVDHFVKQVKHRIKHQAKAMVVCRSIESAIMYKEAFDAYLKERQLPYKAIIAFSGKHKQKETGRELTEEKMNAFADGVNDIPKQLKKEAYKFLIVANKYQTGFDEPLLHTMYVDKKLTGVQAVQTLSRLNRAKKPHKRETFVLDFYNEAEDIKASFKDYYTATILSDETDINKLHDLKDDLDDCEIYDTEILYEYFKGFYSKAERKTLEPIVNDVVSNFYEELVKDQQIDFKSKAKVFYRTYNYLVKIMDEVHQEWEMLALFLKALIPRLKIEQELTDENILEVIEMDSYRTVLQQEKQHILLDPEVGYIEPIPVDAGGGSTEKEFDTLENIVQMFNQRFGGNLSDEAVKILSKQVPEMTQDKKEAIQYIINSDKENAKIASDELLKKIMGTLMFEQTEIFKRYSNDEVFRRKYQDYIFDEIWRNKRNFDRK